MKYLLLVVLVLSVVSGGIYVIKGQTIPYKSKEIVKEKIVEVPSKESEFSRRAHEAIAASSSEIEKAVEEAATSKREEMENEIRLYVTRQMKAELEDQEANLEEKEMSFQ